MSDIHKTPGTDVSNWRDKAMFSAEAIDGKGPRVYLINATPDPLGTMAVANAIYEGKVLRSRRDVTDEMRRYAWEQVAKTHLKAPLEFIDMHFLVEGVTRSFTHQMVRQRTAVYAQESLRFGVKENMVEEIDLPVVIEEGSLEADVWVSAIEAVQDAYNYLINNGIPAEDARGLMPHAVRTRLHYKTNLRNLIDHMSNRLCTQAQFEWRFVLARMVDAIRSHRSARAEWESSDAWQWEMIADSDVAFRPVCYKLGRCPFMGDIDRPCKIRDRVNMGDFGSIKAEEWLLDPNAAR